MTLLFNDLLNRAGLAPKEVRVLRHHTDMAPPGRSLHDLWLADPAAFELYQSTQDPDRKLFRSGEIWAAFTSPGAGRTLFAGLYDARFVERRVAEWQCPLRGGLPGGGQPVDVFETRLRPELAEFAGQLEIEWDYPRNWARYAETSPFAVVESSLPRAAAVRTLPQAEVLRSALLSAGFRETHRTKKVDGYEKGGVPVYVKAVSGRHQLVLHPRYFDIADIIERIAGVEFERPLVPYINSNMRMLGVYEAADRATTSRFGFAISAPASSIPALADILVGSATINIGDAEVRLVAGEDDPVTERERLAAARVGQGEFRYALMGFWGGKCPIAGVDHPKLLRASHIKPWRSATPRERLDPYNGLLLCSHVDALFDAGLISFRNNGEMLVSSTLGVLNLAKLGIRVRAKIHGLTDGHGPYLEHHRREIFLG